MATVVFYEKPGCINNTRQKQLLSDAGHEVDARNLLTTRWQTDELRRYFMDMPLSDWFNPSAPTIKNGEVIPGELDESRALLLMQRDPLLIRRPLMQVGDRRKAGFDLDEVDNWIGLNAAKTTDQVNLESCPRTDNHHCEVTDKQ